MESNAIVLVVDDNEDLRDALVIILSGSGYRCESAKDGVDALKRVRQARFDAVITDVEMPQMDGIALTRELRQCFPDLPVMIITGHSDNEYKETAFRAGAQEFVTKPFNASDLIAKLHKALQTHNLPR
jgi:CheY-like chemotaxis protein